MADEASEMLIVNILVFHSVPKIYILKCVKFGKLEIVFWQMCAGIFMFRF